MAVREQMADEGEPLVTQTRKAQIQGTSSVRVNITSEGRDIVGIEPGDDVQVEVYQNCIRLVPDE